MKPAPHPKRELPIGIFDSGIGGLTVVRQIHHLLPNEDIIYLGDTARVPYGTKAPSTVIRFACEDLQFLTQQNVKAVVVACNTVSAWALPTLEKQFPLPIMGVILPGAQTALAESTGHRIGVIGTHSTIRSRAYERAMIGLDPLAQVFAQACPLLVPLVEEGWINHRATKLILQEYLAPLLRRKIDALVLGCTHYPLLKTAIRQTIGPKIRLVDSAESCARFVRERLTQLELLSHRRRLGAIQPFLTDETTQFDGYAARFLGVPAEPAWRVELTTATQPTALPQT
jgi:glutamate racemase